MFKTDLRIGETIAIGDNVRITLEDKSGKIARIVVDAPKSVPIKRLERSSAADLAAKYGLAAHP